jgi:hypothetical protein
VIGPPPELEVLELELDELELLEEELELLLEEELELRPLELELLELELLDEELELLEPLEVSPPQPSRLSTGTATAAVLIILTILRREAVAVGAIVSSMSILVIVFTIEANYFWKRPQGSPCLSGCTLNRGAKICGAGWPNISRLELQGYVTTY